MSAIKRYYQEVDIRAIFKHYVEGFKMPGDSVVVQWDANYDPHTGKVWFKMSVEEPAPKKDVIVMDFDRTLSTEKGNGKT